VIIRTSTINVVHKVAALGSGNVVASRTAFCFQLECDRIRTRHIVYSAACSQDGRRIPEADPRHEKCWFAGNGRF
jgi:hypothetical protein